VKREYHHDCIRVTRRPNGQPVHLAIEDRDQRGLCRIYCSGRLVPERYTHRAKAEESIACAVCEEERERWYAFCLLCEQEDKDNAEECEFREGVVPIRPVKE